MKYCARFSRRPFTSSIGQPGVHAVLRLSRCCMPGSIRCDVTNTSAKVLVSQARRCASAQWDCCWLCPYVLHKR